MKDTVEKILNSCYTEGVLHSHVSMIRPRGKFQMNSQTIENFFDTYSNLLEKNDNPILGVAEKPQQYIPVLGDIDIKFEEVGDTLFEDLHTEKHTLDVIEVYQSILRNIVEDCSDKMLTCVLLEKPLYRIEKGGKTYAKHGFHIHFPYIFLNKIDYEVHLIPRVKDMVKERNIFADIGCEDSSTFIDASCSKVSWLMYKSRKSADADFYTVTKVINSKGVNIGLEKAFKNYKIFDRKEKVIPVAGKVEYYLPRILSIILRGRKTCSIKQGTASPLKEKLKKKRKTGEKEYVKKSVIENLNLAKKLLPMLKLYRAEDRNEWMTVGWALHNISDGSDEGLELWINFSSRAENQDDDSSSICFYEWQHMKPKDMTIGTLRYFASVDSPEEYDRFKKEQVNMFMSEALDGSHNDVAKLLKEEHGNEFVCSSILNKTWYQFTGHTWRCIEDGIFLKKKISNDVAAKYILMRTELNAKCAETEDKAVKAMYTVRIKQVERILKNLKSSPFKSSVMKECMEEFYDRDFNEKLDTNPLIIAFKNGVYDLRNFLFRDGKPEDYLSKSMNCDYEEYTEASDKVIEVYRFFEKVFPDKDIRRYFMDQQSDVFEGGNFNKIIQFWTGDGNGGKSVTQTIFEKMFGKLAVKFSTTLVTGKKVQAGNANADLARTGAGVRWACCEEPGNNEEINIGIIKNLSGNDSYFARDLFERGKDSREITPMFKFVFVCNKLPKMDGTDGATWNRARVIPFESEFIKEGKPCPKTYAEQLRAKKFPEDKNFTKKIPGLLSAFAWVLLEHRKNITSRVDPDKVCKATEMYRKQNDIYRQYIDEIIVSDVTKKISLLELYSSFKDWYKESMPGHTVPIKNDIKDYFLRAWGPVGKGVTWKGYRIRTMQDMVDSGDIVYLDDDDFVEHDETEERMMEPTKVGGLKSKKCKKVGGLKGKKIGGVKGKRVDDV